MALVEATGRPLSQSRLAYVTAAATILAVLAFAPALFELISRWLTEDEYSHGLLVPVVSLWLLWSRRDVLRASIAQPSWLGPLLIFLATALHVVGQLSTVPVFSWLGFVIALSGIVLGIGGYSLLRASLVPIAFLLFAVPLPGFVSSALTMQLQLVSSQLGAFFIRIVGIPVYLDGNIIDLGTYKLLVAEACSGLRYVFPLLSLSFLAAYVFEAPVWQRALVFLSSIPIAIAMNGFRIGALGVLVDNWGPGAAEGALHFFEGWIVFLACAALLLVEMQLLAMTSGKGLLQVCYLPRLRPFVRPQPTRAARGISPLVACFVLLTIGALMVPTGQSRPLEPRTRFVEFPSRLGPWDGQVLSLDRETEEELRADDYILADYSLDHDKAVNLFIVYYAHLTGKSLHSPSYCIPAGGWSIISQREIGQKHPLNRVVVEKAGKRLLVYYWFDEQGKRLANQWWANFYRLKNSIVEHRSDAALIRLVTEIGSNEPESSADSRLRSFMKITLPNLASYLPSVEAQAANL